MSTTDCYTSANPPPKPKRPKLKAFPPVLETWRVTRPEKENSIRSPHHHDKQLQVSYILAGPLSLCPDDVIAASNQPRSSPTHDPSTPSTIGEIIDLYIDSSIDRRLSADPPPPPKIEEKESQIPLPIDMLRYRATQYRDTIASLIEHQFSDNEKFPQAVDRSVPSLARTSYRNTPDFLPSSTFSKRPSPSPVQCKQHGQTNRPTAQADLDLAHRQHAPNSVPQPSTPYVAAAHSSHRAPTQYSYDRSEYPHFDDPELWYQDVLLPSARRSEPECTCSFCTVTNQMKDQSSSCTTPNLGAPERRTTQGPGDAPLQLRRPVTLVSGRTNGACVRRRYERNVKMWMRGLVRTFTMSSHERRRARLKDSIVMVGSGRKQEWHY